MSGGNVQEAAVAQDISLQKGSSKLRVNGTPI